MGRCFASSPGTNYNSEIVYEADKCRFANREETDLAFLMAKILSSSTVSFQADLALVFFLQQRVLKQNHETKTFTTPLKCLLI